MILPVQICMKSAQRPVAASMFACLLAEQFLIRRRTVQSSLLLLLEHLSRIPEASLPFPWRHTTEPEPSKQPACRQRTGQNVLGVCWRCARRRVRSRFVGDRNCGKSRNALATSRVGPRSPPPRWPPSMTLCVWYASWAVQSAAVTGVSTSF